MKQREIKFRVWDSFRRKMVGPDRWGNELVMDMDGELKWYAESDYQGGRLDLAGTMDLILMQYIGIKDKNGKEIYEDDVILHGTGELRAPGHVRWCEYSHGFKVFRDASRYDIYAPEVIGNLYENPELLQP